MLAALEGIDHLPKATDSIRAVSPEIFAFRITPEIGSIPALLDRLQTYAHAMALPHKIGNRLAIVCEEFAANTAMHGGGATYVEITLRAQPQSIYISIEDDGALFNPLAKAAADTDLRLEDRQIGGLGIHFIRHMLQNISYQRREDCNCLTAEMHWTTQPENDVSND
jgi:serine/threonine-protein kinase RsbW